MLYGDTARVVACRGQRVGLPEQRRNKMGRSLFSKWLEEEVEDLQIVVLTVGIRGLLSEFECWLDRNGYLMPE